MNRLALIVALSLGSSGCFPVYRGINASEDASVVAVREAAKKLRPECDFATATLQGRDSDRNKRPF